MPNEKLRRQIAWDAAQMIRAGQESEYHSARMKAARRIVRGWVPEEDLPSDEEIRSLVQLIASPMSGVVNFCPRIAACFVARRMGSRQG